LNRPAGKNLVQLQHSDGSDNFSNVTFSTPTGVSAQVPELPGNLSAIEISQQLTSNAMATEPRPQHHATYEDTKTN